LSSRTPSDRPPTRPHRCRRIPGASHGTDYSTAGTFDKQLATAGMAGGCPLRPRLAAVSSQCGRRYVPSIPFRPCPGPIRPISPGGFLCDCWQQV
jgi:hypothetical protein